MPNRLRVKWQSRLLLVAGLTLWVPAVGYGVHLLLDYSSTPGHPAEPPGDWPTRASGRPSGQRAVLTLFLHPQCPCSRATIEELALIMACCRDRVEATAYFYSPAAVSAAGPSWTHSDLWRSTAAIPGVKVLEDPGAVNARKFGARTSGQVLLYDAAGHLAFNGGITALRGHAGDNNGKDSIVALLQGATGVRRKTPVFGCALFGDKQE